VAERVPLSQVRVGSTLLLPCRLTAKGAAGVTLETLAENRTTTGSISITPAGVLSGAFTTDPRDQPVKVVAFALSVGEPVRNRITGVVEVVQAVNVGGDPNRWSPSTAGRPERTTDDWEPAPDAVT
jgi:hypothetical protein